MADPDWDDPCAVAAWLKPLLHKVATGQAVASIQHGDQRTMFTQANYASLLTLYRQAVADCAKASGSCTGRRRAFVAG